MPSLKKWLKQYGLKALVVVACFALFLANSWETFSTYNKEQEMESVSILTPSDGRMPFPSLVICPSLAYKNASKVLLSIEDYEENTIDPETFIDKIDWMLTENQKVEWATKVTQELVAKIEKHIIFTVYHGRCLALRYPHKIIPAKQFLTVLIKKPSQVVVYILRPGEEIYLVHAWFPSLTPTALRLPKMTAMYDVVLRYQVVDGDMERFGEEICTQDTDCLKRIVTRFVKNSSCTLPWHWKLIDNGTKDDFRICSLEKFHHQGQDAVKHILEHNDSCKKKCPTTQIKAILNPVNMVVHPCMVGWIENCHQVPPYTEDIAWLYFGYATAEIEFNTKVLRIDFNMFISAIGGGLGLFMGFSIINLIFMIYKGVLRVNNLFKGNKTQKDNTFQVKHI